MAARPSNCLQRKFAAPFVLLDYKQYRRSPLLAGGHQRRLDRRLLMAGAAAVIVLWLLARIRFDDQPAINPVPSVLGQLNVGARFDELASEIDDLQSRLLPQLLTA
jgi:hypothetical protein